MNMTKTAPCYNVTLPNGHAYAIPHSFIDGVHWVDLIDEYDDHFDLERTTPKNFELASALAGLAFVNQLEAIPPLDADIDVPAVIKNAIDEAIQQRHHKISLYEFASVTVPQALRAEYDALEQARFKSLSLDWLEHVRDFCGEGERQLYPMSNSWVAPTARLQLAYRELRKTRSVDELASAIAGAMQDELFSKFEPIWLW